MRVVLKHELNRAKNGYLATAPAVRLTAFGVSPEMARLNLERTVLLMLKPFDRQGVLEAELDSVSVEILRDGEGLSVAVQRLDCC